MEDGNSVQERLGAWGNPSRPVVGVAAWGPSPGSSMSAELSHIT